MLRRVRCSRWSFPAVLALPPMPMLFRAMLGAGAEFAGTNIGLPYIAPYPIFVPICRILRRIRRHDHLHMRHDRPDNGRELPGFKPQENLEGQRPLPRARLARRVQVALLFIKSAGSFGLRCKTS